MPNDLYQTLFQTKENILSQVKEKKSNIEIGNLQTALNRLFYPSEGFGMDFSEQYLKEQSSSQGASIKAEEYESELLRTFAFYDLSKKPIRREKDTRKTFEKNTLIRTLKETSKQLKNITMEISKISQKSYTTKEILQEKVSELKNVMKMAQSYLESNNFSTKKMRFSGEDAFNAIELINYLDTFTKAMTHTSQELSPEQAGDIFEQFLRQAGERLVRRQAQELVEGIKHSIKTGQKTIERGVEQGIVNYNLDFEEDKDFLANDESSAVNLNIKEKNLSITYNPGSKKQGKADVIFTFENPDEDSPYRISAKRWTKGSGDLGETSIDAGIVRAAGIQIAEAYKWGVLVTEKSEYNLANMAHMFAVAALTSDIAMGLNQGIKAGGYGYANLLIVDYANERKIVVKDLTSIINEIMDKVEKIKDIRDIKKGNFPISGYKPKDIESAAISNYNHVKGKNMGERYLGLMTNSLNKMMVTINYSVKKDI